MIIYTCPECGHDLVDLLLTAKPFVIKKECLNCGWTGNIKPENIVRIPFDENETNNIQ